MSREQLWGLRWARGKGLASGFHAGCLANCGDAKNRTEEDRVLWAREGIFHIATLNPPPPRTLPGAFCPSFTSDEAGSPGVGGDLTPPLALSSTLRPKSSPSLRSEVPVGRASGRSGESTFLGGSAVPLGVQGLWALPRHHLSRGAGATRPVAGGRGWPPLRPGASERWGQTLRPRWLRRVAVSLHLTAVLISLVFTV